MVEGRRWELSVEGKGRAARGELRVGKQVVLKRPEAAMGTEGVGLEGEAVVLRDGEGKEGGGEEGVETSKAAADGAVEVGGVRKMDEAEEWTAVEGAEDEGEEVGVATPEDEEEAVEEDEAEERNRDDDGGLLEGGLVEEGDGSVALACGSSGNDVAGREMSWESTENASHAGEEEAVAEVNGTHQEEILEKSGEEERVEMTTSEFLDGGEHFGRRVGEGMGEGEEAEAGVTVEAVIEGASGASEEIEDVGGAKDGCAEEEIGTRPGGRFTPLGTSTAKAGREEVERSEDVWAGKESHNGISGGSENNENSSSAESSCESATASPPCQEVLPMVASSYSSFLSPPLSALPGATACSASSPTFLSSPSALPHPPSSLSACFSLRHAVSSPPRSLRGSMSPALSKVEFPSYRRGGDACSVRSRGGEEGEGAEEGRR